MGLTMDYRKEIISATKELPEDKLRELVDFAHFLRTRGEKFSLAQVRDSAEYVRKLREEEGRKFKSGTFLSKIGESFGQSN